MADEEPDVMHRGCRSLDIEAGRDFRDVKNGFG
jgi:hypothetical protein